MIKENTLLSLDLFKDKFLNSLIFHIPHSSIKIPNEFKNDFIDENITNNEINLLTDFYTHEIFNIENTTKLIFPYSRVFCDVERLPDEDEIMYKVGRGFYYTKTDCGNDLRIENKLNKDLIYNNYYKKHHDELNNLVKEKLKNNSLAIIIDCHSYSDKPFKTDLIQTNNRPDFCLGTDSYHTPNWLIDIIYLHLTNLGFSVTINNPYEGTIIPLEYYNKNNNVLGIMIEVNRKLYLNNDNSKNIDDVKILNDIFNKLFC